MNKRLSLLVGAFAAASILTLPAFAQFTEPFSDPVTAPHRRLTLTLAAVLYSREIIIHISGEAKRAALESACAQGYPVAAVLEQVLAPVSIWWAPG